MGHAADRGRVSARRGRPTGPGGDLTLCYSGGTLGKINRRYPIMVAEDDDLEPSMHVERILAPNERGPRSNATIQIRRLFLVSNKAKSTAVIVPLSFLRVLGWAFGDYIKIERDGERLVMTRIK